MTADKDVVDLAGTALNIEETSRNARSIVNTVAYPRVIEEQRDEGSQGNLESAHHNKVT